MQLQSLGQEDSLKEGMGDPFQYSCLENLMDRGAWWATVCRIAKTWTLLKWLSTHAHSSPLGNFSFVFCITGGWIFDVFVGDVSSANLISSLYIFILQIKYLYSAYEPVLACLIFWYTEHLASANIRGVSSRKQVIYVKKNKKTKKQLWILGVNSAISGSFTVLAASHSKYWIHLHTSL